MTLIEKIKLEIATKLMHDRGWKEDEHPLEWDVTRDDSQMSMIYEDTDYIVNEFLQHITSIGDGEHVNLDDEVDEVEEEEEEETSLFDEYGHLRRKQTNTTTAAIFIFMDAGTGKPRYLKDVRKWLADMDRIGVPDDAEIEGFLHYSHDLELHNAEKIECLECESKDDLLLTVHKCTSGE